MRRVLTTIAAAVVVLAMAGPARAQTVNFTANLSGNQEAPAPGVHDGRVWHRDRDVEHRDPNAHLDHRRVEHAERHQQRALPCRRTRGGWPNGGQHRVSGDISNDFRLTGSATASDLLPRAANGIRSWEDFGQSLVGGQIYINVHSVANPGGEVRGQVIRTQ